MGTRSLTIVQDNEGREIFVLYRQYDGYPTGHGAELKQLLQGFKLVNGLGVEQPPKVANGMGCLAAQIIVYFKHNPGEFYMYPACTRDCGEEYIYTVYQNGEDPDHYGRIYLKIEAGCITFFGLPGTKQKNMPVIYDGLVEDFDSETVERDWLSREQDPANDFLDDVVLSAETIGAD